MTDSFSSDSNEQVEYRRVPPGDRYSSAERTSATWHRCKSAKSSGLRRQRISGLRDKVPVPEHGASTRMRLNPFVSGREAVPSSATSDTFATLLLLRRSLIACKRDSWRSDATTRPC